MKPIYSFHLPVRPPSHLNLVISTLLVAMSVGSSAAYAGVKIGANPLTIGTDNALEVESTSGNKVFVHDTNGKLYVEEMITATSSDNVVLVGLDGEIKSMPLNAFKTLLGI